MFISMQDADLSMLVRRAQGGEEDARDALARSFRPRLEALVSTRLGEHLRDAVEVDDIVQETYLRAFGAIGRFRDEGADSFFRWLGGIANHAILEAARRRKRDVILPLEADLAGGGLSPSRAGRRDERFERLQKALDSLAPDHRRVVLLSRIERLPMREVARLMERTPGAAAQLLFRALEKLRETFGATDSFHLPPRSLEDRGGPP